MRKMSDYEYIHVEHLKNVITSLIDSIIAGEDVEHSKVGTKNKVVSRVVSNPKLSTCNVCAWQTKFASALKAHKKKMHSKIPVANNQLSKETSETPSEPTKKRSNEGFQCNHCDLSFQCRNTLNEHILMKHGQEKLNTPSSSPPRKKIEIDENKTGEDMLVLDDLEINVEKELNISALLQKRISELEIVVGTLMEEKKKEEESRRMLEEQINNLLKPKVLNIPKHLKGVNKKHLPKLRGFKMLYKALADGRCLQNCLAVHGYEDENEGYDIKKLVNHHIADNWDNYYKYKVPLPYNEITGVGVKAKGVEKKTKQEMIDFLRSEDALTPLQSTPTIMISLQCPTFLTSTSTYSPTNEMMVDGVVSVLILSCPTLQK